jgi:Holliday junction resolvase
MAAPSVCHQFAASIEWDCREIWTRYIQCYVWEVTLDVRVPIDRILRDNEEASKLLVTLERRNLRSLKELEELLEELLEKSLRSSSHSQEKRNESEFLPGIQDLVEALPQITVSISLQMNSSRKFYVPVEDSIDVLLELVLKFRTKLHIAFRTPDESARLLQTAILLDFVGLAKFVVAMELLRISNNSCFCPATVVAKVMKCASTLEVVTLLFEICRNPPIDQSNFYQTSFDGSQLWECSMHCQYADLFLKHIGTLPHFLRLFGRGLDSGTDKTNDTMKSFGSDISKSYHQNQKLPGVWNLTAEVHGLLLPRQPFNPQVLKLQVSLQPVVTGACSMAIGVRNVQVRIQNASLDSSPSNLLGFFLSHVTVSIRPEVEGQQVLLMLVEVPSPNEPYDISATRTIGVSASATGGKNPGVAVTATESSSATIKSITTDWRHEQTRGDEFTGNFSWTLRRLAGVPFDYAQPKCTKVSTRMSIFRPRPVTSILERPFNSDGSVTFSEQCPKIIQWTLEPELAGTDVAWYVSATVYVTMLDRSTGKSKTLEFWSPYHFLHNMSTDVKE